MGNGAGEKKGRNPVGRWRRQLALGILLTGMMVVVLSFVGHSLLRMIILSAMGLTIAFCLWKVLSQIERLAAELGYGAKPGQSPLQALQLALYHTTEVSARDRNRHTITGLPTREVLVEQMTRDKSGTLGLVAFADFDRLCSFDPAYADWAIEQLARRMVKLVGPDRMIAHVDRSAFVLWFDKGEPQDDARRQLDAIGYALGNAMTSENGDLVPTIRLHLASFSAEVDSPKRSLEKILATCANLNASVVAASHAPSQSDLDTQSEYELEQQLRFAIQHGELELQFQPQIDAGTCTVAGAEALLRWNHPQLGLVSPHVAIPLLEKSGLIEEVGLWIVNSACREARKWRDLGLPLSVAVNISSHQLTNLELHPRLVRILKSHGLSPDALEVELTESAAAQDPERAARFFQAMRDSGISAAIDDFGTGFSSLSTLRALRFDKIKIDREFVTSVDSRRDSQAICQSIIALARGLGIRVIAEGVECHEEYSWLRKHGCSEFQGYYFSHPLSGPDFLSYVERSGELHDHLSPNPSRIRETLLERLNS